jgi:hypothetical protein
MFNNKLRNQISKKKRKIKIKKPPKLILVKMSVVVTVLTVLMIKMIKVVEERNILRLNILKKIPIDNIFIQS